MTTTRRTHWPLIVLAALLAAAGCRGGGSKGDADDDTGEDADDAQDLAVDGDEDTASDIPGDPAGDDDGSTDAPQDTDEEDNGCIGEDPIIDTSSDGVETDPLEDGILDAAEEELADAGDADGTTSFTCGDLLVDSRDGNTYSTVLIGTQCWMAQNLNVGVMISGATRQLDNGVIEKHCYDNYSVYCLAFGGLYEWDEMMDYGPSDAGNPSTTQGICPAGWHVPSDEEWKVLEMFLGMTSTEADMVNGWRGTGAGTALKVGGSSGYDAKMAGRDAGGAFSLIGLNEYMYTSTEYYTNAWRRCLAFSADTVGRWNTFPKSWGLSVRCVLD
jgi:uncharacterized protein (TIGR02145 family)